MKNLLLILLLLFITPSLLPMHPKKYSEMSEADQQEAIKNSEHELKDMMLDVKYENKPDKTRMMLEKLRQDGIPLSPNLIVWGIQFGSLEQIKILIEFGADPRIPSPLYPGQSALHFAAERGDVEIMKFLIENYKFDVNVGYLERPSWAKESDPNTNYRLEERIKVTPFTKAAYVNNENIMQFLMSYGAEPALPPKPHPAFAQHREKCLVWTQFFDPNLNAGIAKSLNTIEALNRLSTSLLGIIREYLVSNWQSEHQQPSTGSEVSPQVQHTSILRKFLTCFACSKKT